MIVPVNMDDPDPTIPGPSGTPISSGGLVGVAVAIDYNPSFFSITGSEVNFGTLTNNTDTVQTITFAGGVTGGSFSLGFGGSTTNIPYSTAAATLQSSIQSALDGLGTIGAGNTLVSAVSATDVTVTFQGTFANQAVTTMTSNGSGLNGANPTVAVATTTTGFAAWGSAPTANIGVNTNAVQTIAFTGTVTGGSFLLAIGNNTTGPIAYSTAAATLQSNIQAALNTLAGVGSGNSLVTATSATSVKVTFEGALAAQPVPTFTDDPTSLQGTSPGITVTATTAGYAGLGQIGVTESTSVPNINTVGGSILLLTFNVLATAPGGATPIYIEGTNTPGGTLTVVTRLDAIQGQIPLSPVPVNGNVPGVDGLVTIQAPHFVVSAGGRHHGHSV